MKRILLAVSGGIDSMYLAEKAPELFPGASFAVAHCNFGLRGKESDGDEEFVRQWCSAHGVECFVKRFDTTAYAAENGISIEMAARELRYAWFAELCGRGFEAVAVAHNADDNAETFLLNLVRGTGPRGLRGMAADVRDGRGVRILRPLLDVSRAEIQEWMVAHGYPWREDSSNSSSEYKRNRIRREVLPVLKELNPSLLETLSADMAHLAQVDDIAEEYYSLSIASWLPKCSAGSSPSGLTPPPAEPAVPPLPCRGWHVPAEHICPQEAGTEMSTADLMALRHWKYVLWRWLEPYGFDSGTVGALTELLEKYAAVRITFAGKTFEAPEWRAVTTSDSIAVLPRSQGVAPEVKTEVFDRTAGFSPVVAEGVLVADADKLPLPLKIRKWQAGDWMVPLGMKGRKKLSDLFVDLKWSLPQKESALVAEHPDGKAGHIAALLCIRIDDSLKVSATTRRILRISSR